MKNLLSPQQVQSKVNKTKARLVKKWNKSGGYENFGQTEVRKLSAAVLDSSDRSSEMQEIRDIIQDFNDWAVDFDGFN